MHVQRGPFPSDFPKALTRREPQQVPGGKEGSGVGMYSPAPSPGVSGGRCLRVAPPARSPEASLHQRLGLQVAGLITKSTAIST